MGRRGQAPALNAQQWKLWLEWLKERAGPRVWLAVFLTGALGLRCSEALTSKRENIQLDGATPKITIDGQVPGARKSPGEVYVRKQHVDTLRQALRAGVCVQRVRGHKYGKGLQKNISYSKDGRHLREATSSSAALGALRAT